MEKTLSAADEPVLGFHPAQIKIEPYEPFGYRNKEDTNAGRFFFINRKQDRFTLNCNYREHGVNSNGKKYGRFKKLFSLTVTLREPKTVGKMSLNVFYQGNIGGKRYKLLNITRNPSLVLGAFPSELNTYIINEILNLTSRQKFLPANDLKTLEKEIHDSLKTAHYSSETAIKLISRIAYPMLASQLNKNQNVLHISSLKIHNNNFETFLPPIFAMPLIREPDVESLMKSLKILPENKEFFTQNIKTWNVDALYYLNIAKGLVDSGTQRKLLNFFAEGNSSYKVTAHSWDEQLTGFYVPRVRQIVKTLNKESRNKILLDSNFIGSLSKLVRLWIGRSKFEKTIRFSKNINTVSDLYVELAEELAERKIELNTIKNGSINTLLNELNDGSIFSYNDSFDKSLSGGFGAMSVYLPADAQESGTYKSWFYYGEVNKTSPLWKPIFEDEHFIVSPVEAGGFIKTVNKNRSTETQIIFSPKMYLKFLETLKELTLNELKKNKMEFNKTNYAFVALIILVFNSYNGFTKYSPIPRKMFTLYKAGLHPIVIDYALRKKLSTNMVKEYAGLPLEWVEKLLGVREGMFTKNATVF